MTFGQKILAGLALGLATGLFLGELAAPLRLLADGFVRLLQMTVLPYVTVSLIVGIGSLDPAAAKRLFLRVDALPLVLWGRDGTIQALYDHWILGKDAKAKTKRWSILRNVLGFRR